MRSRPEASVSSPTAPSKLSTSRHRSKPSRPTDSRALLTRGLESASEARLSVTPALTDVTERLAVCLLAHPLVARRVLSHAATRSHTPACVPTVPCEAPCRGSPERDDLVVMQLCLAQHIRHFVTCSPLTSRSTPPSCQLCDSKRVAR